MLIEFRVENHRSIRDEQAFTMEAGPIGDANDPRLRHVPGHSAALLPVAAIYGANASGKSNVLDALAFMRSAILDSHRIWDPQGRIPRDPFAWGSKNNDPSMYEATLLLNGIRYQFGFVAADQSFLEEWLYAWPNGKKQVWYERDSISFKFGEHLKGENRLIEEVTRPNALFLSAAAQHNHFQIRGLYSWFKSLSPLNLLSGRRRLKFMAEDSDPYIARLAKYIRQPSLAKNAASVEQFRMVLRSADVGIEDIRIRPTESNNNGSSANRTQIQLKHKSSTDEAWLPLQEESQGTQTFFDMALRILEIIQVGGHYCPIISRIATTVYDQRHPHSGRFDWLRPQKAAFSRKVRDSKFAKFHSSSDRS